jgi:hypothetical protein
MALPNAKTHIAVEYLNRVLTAMIWTLLTSCNIPWCNAALSLNAFLKHAPIIKPECIRIDRRKLPLEQWHHERANAFKPTIEVECRQQRLKCVGQQSFTRARTAGFLTPAQAQIRTEIE